MIRSLTLAVLPLLAACVSDPAAERASENVESLSTEDDGGEDAQPQSEGFEGRYALVRVDGAPVAGAFENSRPTLLIDGEAIHFASQCVGHSWSWSKAQRGMNTGRYVPPPSPDGAIRGMCARGFTVFEQAVVDGFTDIEGAQLLADGDPVVTGGGHILEWQRLSTPDISLRGLWRVKEIDGEVLPADGALVLGGNDTQLVWEPRCAGIRVDFVLGLSDGWADWSAEQYSTVGQPVCSIGLPARLGDAMQAITTADRVEWSAGQRLVYTGGGHSLTLERFQMEGA